MSDNEITLVQPERSPLPVPMTENWDHEMVDTARAMPTLPGGYFDFVQQYGTNGSTKPFALTRPSPPPPEQKPAPAAAPPPPPEPRPRAQRSTDIPPPFASAPVEMVHAPIRPPTIVHEHVMRNAPSTIPPPVAIEARTESVPPPPSGRAWASMFTIGPLSALVAALVSSLVWSFHTNDLKSAAIAEEKAAVLAAANSPPPCTTRPGATPDGNGTTSTIATTPASLATALQAPAGVTPQVSIDALPTVGSGPMTKASFVTGSESSSSDVPSSSRSRASRTFRAVERPAPARPVVTADATSSAASTPEAVPEPAAPALPKGPDRAAVTKAMGRAAKAASSCGSGPQEGRVSLTIAPAGTVTSVSLVKGFGDAGVNACVLRAFGRAKISAYDGDPIQVKKAVRW